MNNPIEIKDIMIPNGVSAFPLAYGWWTIIIGIIFLVLAVKIILWILKTSKKHYALKELKNIDTDSVVDSAIKMSLLLRRICNVKYKQASVLYGKEWLDFLRNTTNAKLSLKAADLLIFAPFISKNDKTYSDVDAKNLKTFCKSWIGDNL
ncbi:MAG: DUF4381 domain-containing protein [Alphaproteobacteria bacterium]|nr:DUF4381 domain-containing protein [Alphaproteobacteria bacterium]